MGRTYANPDVDEGTKEQVLSKLSQEGPCEPWYLVRELVDEGVQKDAARKALRVLTLDGELTTTPQGEVEMSGRGP